MKNLLTILFSAFAFCLFSQLSYIKALLLVAVALLVMLTHKVLIMG